MKERSLFDDEFEKQLKEKSDQFKMYPSDKVWNEVYSNLHTRHRRFVIGMTVLIGGILTLAGSQLITPAKNTLPVQVASKPSVASKLNAPAAKTNPFTASRVTMSKQSDPEEISGDAADLTPIISFPFSTALAPVNGMSGEEKKNTVPETVQTAIKVKPNPTIDVSVGQKTETLIAATEKAESESVVAESASLNHVAAELSPENTPTQLSHIKNDRFSWEVYFTPTLNTHYLTGMNYQTMAPAFQNAPIMVIHYANVNGFVDNTPVLGYNLGGNIMYKISRNISLKAGIEFSFNRYYIKAYNSNPGQASAQLNSYFGYVADSLQNISTGRSIDKNPQHYQNRYYQLSVPVGLDMKVAGNGKLQVHIGATVQPTYLLNTDAYVLSSDYTSYTKDPEAFRRLNLNVGGEVYLSYAVGKIRWELGPQVRYQLFSTYKNTYPLRENMLNYGIRIGISKSIR